MALVNQQELFDESCHFTLLDDSVSVGVEFLEEGLELLHAWWTLSLSLENIVEEVGCLDLVKDTAAISVIVVPELVDLILDELLLCARKFSKCLLWRH